MLVLTQNVYDTVLDHAMDAVPQEACGVLGGTYGPTEDAAVAITAHPTENAAATPTLRYAIDPEELIEVVETIEQASYDVVGFYHSHPAGPASPSEIDHREAAWVDHHYVIVSLVGRPPTLDAWVWDGERFERDAVSVRPDETGGASDDRGPADVAGTRRD